MAETRKNEAPGNRPDEDAGVKRGRLSVVATPIGNLGDLSPRAVEVLQTADLIAAEDTRVTMKLCQVFSIHARLVSVHRHNEGEKSGLLASRIAAEGLNAALVTDAGTPCISDPGHELVAACLAEGVEVIAVPGCCAAVAAISVSGFDAREFAFYGFLPRERKPLREKLREIGRGVRVAAVHESPYRIIELTEAIAETLPEARLTVCCDLTKLHEKTLYGTPDQVLSALRANEKTEKGEYCVILDLHQVPEEEGEHAAPVLSPEGRLAELLVQGLSPREAQDALVAEGVRKNAAKQAMLNLRRLFENGEDA